MESFSKECTTYGPFDEGWAVKNNNGEIIAIVETEKLADIVLAGVTGHSAAPPEYPSECPIWLIGSSVVENKTLFYKIICVHDWAPDSPEIFEGEFGPNSYEHPILTALAIEFGRGVGPAVETLQEWSNGGVGEWVGTFQGIDDEPYYWKVLVGDTTYYVKISDRREVSDG